MWKEHAFQPGGVIRDPQTGLGYRLAGLIGRGAYAEVYGAECVETRAPCALKVLQLHRTTNPKTRERHRREGEVLRRITHPNLVHVHAVFEAPGGAVVMVMDLLLGRTLAQLRDECGGKLPINTALEIMAQVCGALDVAHSLGIVHRDVKPQNIFVCSDGSARLCDFGASQFPNSVRITTADTTLGTPEYMSPEQLYDTNKVGPASDLFAVGVVLYEAVSGMSPFAVDGKLPANFKELGSRIIFQPHAPLRSVAKDAPEYVAELVELLLVKEIEQRLASAADVGRALKAAHRLYLDELAARKVEPVRISFVGRLPPAPPADTDRVSMGSVNPFISVSAPPDPPANDATEALAPTEQLPTRRARVSGGAFGTAEMPVLVVPPSPFARAQRVVAPPAFVVAAPAAWREEESSLPAVTVSSSALSAPAGIPESGQRPIVTALARPEQPARAAPPPCTAADVARAARPRRPSTAAVVALLSAVLAAGVLVVWRSAARVRDTHTSTAAPSPSGAPPAATTAPAGSPSASPSAPATAAPAVSSAAAPSPPAASSAPQPPRAPVRHDPEPRPATAASRPPPKPEPEAPPAPAPPPPTANPHRIFGTDN